MMWTVSAVNRVIMPSKLVSRERVWSQIVPDGYLWAEWCCYSVTTQQTKCINNVLMFKNKNLSQYSDTQLFLHLEAISLNAFWTKGRRRRRKKIGRHCKKYFWKILSLYEFWSFEYFMSFWNILQHFKVSKLPAEE